MTTCLGKSCSFGLPRVPFVINCFPFGFEGLDGEGGGRKSAYQCSIHF